MSLNINDEHVQECLTKNLDILKPVTLENVKVGDKVIYGDININRVIEFTVVSCSEGDKIGIKKQSCNSGVQFSYYPHDCLWHKPLCIIDGKPSYELPWQYCSKDTVQMPYTDSAKPTEQKEYTAFAISADIVHALNTLSNNISDLVRVLDKYE